MYTQTLLSEGVRLKTNSRLFAVASFERTKISLFAGKFSETVVKELAFSPKHFPSNIYWEFI